MEMILINFFIGLILSFIAVPIVIRYVSKKSLLDKPDERKEHKVPTPTLGGIAIFVGFATTVLTGGSSYFIVPFLSCITMLMILGIKDDIYDLSPKIKFLAQITAASVICASGIRLESLYGLFGIYELSISMQYLFSIFLIVGLTNAFNLIDGIDGLAGGIGMMNMLVLGIAFSIVGNFQFAAMSFGMVGALLAFLYYNYNPARIFMGDTGSLVIGFTMAVFSIKLIQVNDMVIFNIQNIHIIVFGLLILPVLDTLRLFAARMINGNSPFKADRNHLHHFFIKLGYNHKNAANALYFMNISLILASVLLRDLRGELALFILILLNTIFSEFLIVRYFLKGYAQLAHIKRKTQKIIFDNNLYVRDSDISKMYD